MADWTKPLPDEAVEGADTHVEDHNKILAALEELRDTVDDIELTPGKDGDDGTDGDDGKDGAPSQEEWDALVKRVTDLEGDTEG